MSMGENKDNGQKAIEEAVAKVTAEKDAELQDALAKKDKEMADAIAKAKKDAVAELQSKRDINPDVISAADQRLMDDLGEYEALGHVVVPGIGHLYPDTEENRKIEKESDESRPSRCVMSAYDARRFGPKLLRRIGDAKRGAERNKIVSQTVNK